VNRLRRGGQIQAIDTGFGEPLGESGADRWTTYGVDRHQRNLCIEVHLAIAEVTPVDRGVTGD
jgi:hypothetical protein